MLGRKKAPKAESNEPTLEVKDFKEPKTGLTLRYIRQEDGAEVTLSSPPERVHDAGATASLVTGVTEAFFEQHEIADALPMYEKALEVLKAKAEETNDYTTVRDAVQAVLGFPTDLA